MGILSELTGVLGQYANANPNQPPPNVESDFDHVAQTAPSQSLAEGLSHAFRSDATPSFGQMAAQLFGNANPQQRAGILGTLLGSLGPNNLGQLAGQGTGLADLVRSFQGGSVNPANAQQVSPESVQKLADHAATQNPSVVDEVSHFVAQHPTLVKTLGATALTIAMNRMAHGQRLL